MWFALLPHYTLYTDEQVKASLQNLIEVFSGEDYLLLEACREVDTQETGYIALEDLSKCCSVPADTLNELWEYLEYLALLLGNSIDRLRYAEFFELLQDPA
jgi:hypothetical protein